MNIVLDTGKQDGLKDPDILGKIAALQDTLESLELVKYTTSLADYIKRINFVMNENDPAFNRIPTKIERVTEIDWDEEDNEIELEVEVKGRDLIAQYVLLYENAGGDNLEKLTDYDYSKANIVAQIRGDMTPLLRHVRDRAQAFSEVNFSDGVVNFAGCSSLCIVADDLIIPSQLKSLGIAVGVVFVLLSLIFRSIKLGFIGLLPLILTVLLVFGLMSLFGVYLDAVTALIASIVLGVGIDYSVHFLSRYRSLRRHGVDFQQAIQKVQTASGRAIVFNSIAVAMGFAVLLFSSFWPVIHIGWLVGANMVISAGFAMLLIPAVLKVVVVRANKKAKLTKMENEIGKEEQ